MKHIVPQYSGIALCGREFDRSPELFPSDRGIPGDCQDCQSQWRNEEAARLGANEQLRGAISTLVPVWRMPGGDAMVYSTWWGGTPVRDGIPYSDFVGHMSVADARQMGASEH